MLRIEHPRYAFWLFHALLTAILIGCFVPRAGAQNSPHSLDDYLSQGRQLESAQDYAGAERLYLDAQRAFPSSAEVLKRLGIIEQTEVKLTESIDAFQQALAIDSKYPEVNFYLGLSYFGLNQFDLAIASFEKELDINPKYKRAHYYEAQVYQSTGRGAEAYRQYQLLLQIDPSDKKVLFQLIRFLKSSTLQAINQLGNIDANSIYMLVLKAESNTEAQDYNKAVEQYQQVLAKDPNFPGIHFALGEVYYGKVDFANAEKELRLALQEDPNHPKANYYLADILVKGGKMAEAVPLLELSVPGDPKFMKGYFLLGKCYAAQGRLDESRKLLEKAEELDSSDKNVHYQLAQLYTRMNEPAKSQEQMKIFQKLYAEERAKKAENMDENQRKMSTPANQ